MEVVTNRENVLRGNASRRKTVCKHGHQLTDDNVYTSPDGERQCRTCRAIRDKELKNRRYNEYYRRYNELLAKEH